MQAGSEVLTISVPWDPIVTGANKDRVNSRRGGYRKAGLHAKARAVARKAWEAAGSPRIDVPVRVSLRVYRGRAMDLANIWGGCKPLLDGLFTDAVTPDDSLRWVRELGGVRLETGKQWKGAEEVVFVIEPLSVGRQVGVGGEG